MVIGFACPGRDAARSAAAQSRDPRHTDRSERWAPALQRTAPHDASHRRGRCAASGARERNVAHALSSSSLRAQRSNPESLRGKTLDCFAALAMTKVWRWLVLQVSLSFPATRLRQGFAGVEVQGRRSFSVGGRRGIQYAAASRLNHCRLGVLNRPVKPGDDSACVVADTPSQPRGAFRPSFASSLHPLDPRGHREGRVLNQHPRSAAQNIAQGRPHSSIQV
ncbi:hypothetical protein GGD63_002429 [Bradyrhizobium sp. cir1]|nr:hypothetical protein [Bradyrhizobium sp. cir1]